MALSQTNDDIKKDKITLSPYDTNWLKQAQQEIKKIQNTIHHDNLIDIQHIGSTSIPNILAKPIIDIYIGVKLIPQAKQQDINSICSLGYTYWDENPNPYKLFFVKGMPPYGEKRTHHIHIVEYSSHYWRDRIAFRDYLQQHPEEASYYSNLKQELASRYTYDREAYTHAKSTYIITILKKAGIHDGGKQ